jgi:transglutaminase-like putative cysteine protease
MPVFKIQHITRYEYDRPVIESANQIKIYPYARPDQETINHQLQISHSPSVHTYDDYWGNTTGLFMVSGQHQMLEIDSRVLVRTKMPAINPMSASKPTEWDQIKATASKEIALLDLSKPANLRSSNEIQAIVTELRPLWDAPALFIQRCSEYIYQHFQYKKGITNVESTVDEILMHKQGVCQDFAHVMLQMLRSIGMPVRYVSGYICPNRDGVRGAGATHAWVEVFLPSAGGWVGIDPTNNTWVSDQHVSLAVGRHFNDCSPVKGTFKGPANQSLFVYVSVGFEDGTSFEDRTRVQMSVEEPLAPRQDFDQSRQQQQQ